MTPLLPPTFTLVDPFPIHQFPLVWQWLNEFPLANFDDYGPKTEREFVTEMLRRAEYEAIVGVESAGELVGAIGYLPLSPRSGCLHGICFTSKTHGTGLPFHAVRAFLESHFTSGVDKISASFNADNRRMYQLAQRLGAVEEGYLRRQTMRGGKPLDKYLIAFFNKGDK